jgi:hypothetical protein
MKGPGILWMMQTAAGFSLAGPLFYLAATYLLSANYAWGALFLTFGLLVLYFPTYLVNRIRRRFGRAKPGSDGPSESDEADRAESGSRSALERLRSR